MSKINSLFGEATWAENGEQSFGCTFFFIFPKIVPLLDLEDELLQFNTDELAVRSTSIEMSRLDFLKNVYIIFIQQIMRNKNWHKKGCAHQKKNTPIVSNKL